MIRLKLTGLQNKPDKDKKGNVHRLAGVNAIAASIKKPALLPGNEAGAVLRGTPEEGSRNKNRIRINLQLFAGDKTEKATPKRRSEARKKGQVLQSREISSAVVLLAIVIGLRLFGGYIYNELYSFTKRIIVDYPQIEDLFSLNILARLFVDTLTVLLKTTGPVLAIAVTAGLVTEYAQVGFLFTVETLGFKFSKINPLTGLQRIFSLKAVVELLKAVIKIVVVGFVVYSYLKGEINNVMTLMSLDVMGVAIYIGTTCINVAIRICVVMIIIGVFDYLYQWWEYEKSLKMSKQDIKEEHKQQEGNPEIKSKIRQKQREMSLRRMLHDVPKADVVITNPTHFAVAVKYDSSVSQAPVVLAKGQDFIALRIKEVAKEHNVEVVENKLLARTLYQTVEVGQSIPPDLYQAVAEILAFVYGLKGKNRAM